MESDALSSEQALKQVRQFEIEPECNAREKFQHRHFRTQSIPDGTQFEANCASADHDEFLWSLSELQRFGAADDCFAVKFCERQFHRCAAGRNNDILCLDVLCFAAGRFNRNFSWRADCAETFENRRSEEHTSELQS